MKSSVWHTVTLIVSSGGNPTNHLNLMHRLQCIIATHCTCEQGARTNGACSHIQAFVIAAFCPQMFRTAKKPQGRLTDIRRPTNQNPQVSGPPGETRDFNVLGRAAAATPRRSLDSRRNQRKVYTRQRVQPQRAARTSIPNQSHPTTRPVIPQQLALGSIPGQVGHLQNQNNKGGT